ncbi:toll/interleukin-1 receptor domain-containing protein [Desulfobacterales bacterium HSG2]|nr:toll/interleukin-1 receptor domain-containing protein [Desulfobacterales bacterium HSG2]
MNPEDKTYRTLLHFALETDIGFSLLIVQSGNDDLQTRWRDRLASDLSQRGIKLIAIEGKDLPAHAGARGIARDIRKHVPESGPRVISLSHLEEHTRPVIRSSSEKDRTAGPGLRPAPLITRINVERDDLVRAFPVPCILWVSPNTVRQMAEFAPDFYDIRDSEIRLPEAVRSGSLPNQSGKLRDIFISHNSECVPWVEVLVRNLEDQGYRVFLDIRELAPAESIADELCRGLKESRKGILVVTAKSIESGWVRETYNRMTVQQSENPDFAIIPVTLGKGVPDFPFLRDVRWLDFRNPETYRKAFCHLICAMEERHPGPDAAFRGELIMPPELTEEQPNQIEISFAEELFELFHTKQAVLLLAQGDRGQSAVKSSLSEQAGKRFHEENLIRLVLPYSPRSHKEDYFSVLGRQCGFSESVTSSAGFVSDFEERLKDRGEPLLIMVSGFENSCDEGLRDIAGAFRSLGERCPNLRFLLCGGERLADLFFVGTLSFPNSAEVCEWPELTAGDVHCMWEHRCPGQVLSERRVGELLHISGGHPGLLQQCLDFYHRNACSDPDTCKEALIQTPFVWQLFMSFIRDTAVRQRLCRLFEQNEVGDVRPYIFDPLLRRLYWRDLIKQSDDGKRLVWRCEVFRVVGRQVLECGYTDCG